MVDNEGRARVTDFGIARAGASEITADRLGARHRPVPLARAGAGPRGHRRLRHLLGRRDPLRGAHRPGPVRRRDARRRRAQAGLRAAAAAERAQPGRSPARSTPSSCGRSRRSPRTATRRPTSSSAPSTSPRRTPPAARSATPRSSARSAPRRRRRGRGRAGAAAGRRGGPGTGEDAAGGAQDGPKKLFTRRRVIALAVLALIGAGVATWALTRPEQVDVPAVIGEQPTSRRRRSRSAASRSSETPVATCAPEARSPSRTRSPGRRSTRARR